MKKWLAIWLALVLFIQPTAGIFALSENSIEVDIPVPEFRGAVLDIGAVKVLEAHKDGVALEVSVNYEDIKKNPFKKEIIRMAALGIARRQGSEKFHPEQNITGFEALGYLTRLVGEGEQIEQGVLPRTGGLSEGSIKALYEEAYANAALARGILVQDEYTELDKPAKKEQLAVWVARTIGQEPIYGNIDRVFGFKDYDKVTPSYLGTVEALLKKEIMTSGNDGYFRPKSPLSRGAFMAVLDKAFETQHDAQKIKIGYGLVTGIKKDTEQQVGHKIEKRSIIIRNVDGSVSEIRTRINQKTKQKQDFIIYKDGVQAMSSAVLIGDEIQYFLKNDVVVYAEVVSDNTVLEKIRKTEEKDAQLTTYFGTIYEILTHKRWKNDRHIEAKRYRVRTFDGQTFDLVVETDLYSGVKNDILVYKNRKIGGTDLLEKGDTLSFVVKNNDSVVYISALPLWEKTIKGTVRQIKTDDKNKRTTVTVFGYDDIIYEYPVAPYATVAVNDIFGNLKDLRYGQNVTLNVNQGYVVSVKAESFSEKPGYIPEYGKSRSGKIYALYPAGFVLESGGKRKTYNLSQDAPITKAGVAITYKALREGDSVRLFFDDIYTNSVSRLEVEGAQRLIKKVYKGQLSGVNVAKKAVTLSGVRYLKNDHWETDGDYAKTLDLAQEAYLYSGDKTVPIENLQRHYKDKTVYVVVEDVYGKSMVSKLTIKSGGENVYSDTIRKVDNVLGRLELDNQINFDLTKGTIVLKEGRVVDLDLLSRRDNVLIVSDTSLGKSRANVVKLLGQTETIFDRVYVGVVENVTGNFFTTRYWSRMSDNEWNDVDASVSDKFFYHTSTLIQDVSAKNKTVQIRPVDFFHKSFGRMENKKKTGPGVEYKRYYTLFVLKGEKTGNRSVVAMNLRYKGFLPDQNIDDKIKTYDKTKGKLENILKDMFLTRGVVDSTDEKWKRIKLTDSNDWVASVAEWRTNRKDVHVEYENALVVKGDKHISIDDIQPGDDVYILRNNEKAQVIFLNEE